VTALPYPRLLTIAEYAELGEVESGYTELLEGRLLMSPSLAMDHNNASLELAFQLRPQLPNHLEVLLDIDVDLELVPADQPGYSRRPDLVIAQRSARQRQRREGGILRACEVAVIVEIVSPSSRYTDHKVKHGEYADAGIPHYWIVDVDEPVSLVECHLAGEFGYQDSQAVSGEFSTTEPFPITLRLDQLL
jgi:Uma2 family endonuclease